MDSQDYCNGISVYFTIIFINICNVTCYDIHVGNYNHEAMYYIIKISQILSTCTFLLFCLILFVFNRSSIMKLYIGNILLLFTIVYYTLTCLFFSCSLS